MKLTYLKRFAGLFLLMALSFAVKAEDNSKYVDLIMGTAGDNGQVDPAACLPYGMVRICPDSDPRSHSGYDYDVTKTRGFSINRISGIGCSGAGGNLRVKPALKDEEIHLNKSTEAAMPGYYTVTLSNGVKAEVTATNNTGFERFYFPQGQEAHMSFDVGSSFSKVVDAKYEIVSDTEIKGYIHSTNTCNHGAYKLYFHLASSRPFIVVDKEDRKVDVKFLDTDNKPVDIRLTISALNEETARHENLLAQKLTFDKVRKNAAKAWDKILSKVEVKGGSKDEKTLFYTAVYRTFLTPANVTSWDGKFLGTDGNIYDADGFTYYSSWSMWDSYRTKFPLMFLLDAERASDISKSLCKLFMYGKKDWATPFESTPTVRTEHSITVVLDAYKKGADDVDLEAAYAGMKAEMEALQTTRPDQAFETAIDLWSMSEIAQILNKNEDAEYYSEKARNLFLDSWNKHFKDIDESFTNMRNSGLYQGTRWQYRWGVPQYLDDMIASVGGKGVLADQLETYFDKNLHNQTNEPGLHTPFLFNKLGRPEKTQEIARKYLSEEVVHIYGGNAEYKTPVVRKTFVVDPKGYLPEMDEDDGTMSAWYVFSSIGLYPLIVGEPWYEILSPAFDEVTIKFDNGKKLKIKAKNRKSKTDAIKSIAFNGKPITDYQIDHNDIMRGGTLELKY